MNRIINGEAVENHIINRYKFKNFDDENAFVEEKDNAAADEDTKTGEPFEKPVEKETQKNSETIEKLLKKIEELSHNIVNIQTGFERQLKECKEQIEAERKRAFEEGYKKGKEESGLQIRQELEEKINMLQQSVRKIDKINEIFEEKIISIEKELISVALDIAKEVIQKEVSENSREIAYNLAKTLMEDIKDATKIQIKVNPKDAQYLKKQDLKNVEIIEDEAVKEGGVVIISDIGNIDAEILQRFKAIKEAVLEGNE
ncbi:flagellar assembly protein FliH [Nautilia sp.]